jgi:hypothetical protein
MELDASSDCDSDEHYEYRINPTEFFHLPEDIRNRLLDEVWHADDLKFPDSRFRIDEDWTEYEFAGLGFTDIFDGFNDYHNEECARIDDEIKECILDNVRDWLKVAKIMYFFGIQCYDFGFIENVHTLVDFVEVFYYGCFYGYRNPEPNHILNRWCTGCFDIDFILEMLTYGDLKENDSDDEEFLTNDHRHSVRDNFPWRVPESMCRGMGDIGCSSSNLFAMITVLGRIYRDLTSVENNSQRALIHQHVSTLDRPLLVNRIPKFFLHLSQVKTIPDGGPYDRITYHYFADTHYQYVPCGLPLLRPRWINTQTTPYCNNEFRDIYECMHSILKNEFKLFPMIKDPFNTIMAYVFDYQIDCMYKASALYEEEIDAIIAMDEDAKIKLYLGYGICPDVEELMDYRIGINGEEQDDTELKFGFNNDRIVADDVLRMGKGLRIEQRRLDVYRKVLLGNIIFWEKIPYLIMCITGFVGEKEMPCTDDEICNAILMYMASNSIKLEDVYYNEYEFSITDAFQIAKTLK